MMLFLMFEMAQGQVLQSGRVAHMGDCKILGEILQLHFRLGESSPSNPLV